MGIMIIIAHGRHFSMNHLLVDCWIKLECMCGWAMGGFLVFGWSVERWGFWWVFGLREAWRRILEGWLIVIELGLECHIVIMAMITMPVVQNGDSLTSCLVVEFVWWDFWWALGLREAQRQIFRCRPICCDVSLLVLFSTSPFSRSVAHKHVTSHNNQLNDDLQGREVDGERDGRSMKVAWWQQSASNYFLVGKLGVSICGKVYFLGKHCQPLLGTWVHSS